MPAGIASLLAILILKNGDSITVARNPGIVKEGGRSRKRELEPRAGGHCGDHGTSWLCS